MSFQQFSAAVFAQFAFMSQYELYRLSTSGDKIWELYLGAFPPGTDPLFKTKTQHDGSYDRHFVRDLGNVAAVLPDGSITTIWDARGLETPYAEVCAAIRDYLKNDYIVNLFRTAEARIGHEPNTVQLPDGTTHQFTHFLVPIDSKFRVIGSKSVDTVLGEANARAGVFRRGLTEITREASETVLDLISQKVLYRGDEFESLVLGFRAMQFGYNKLTTPAAGNNYIWTHHHTAFAGIRNTVIGTLLTDLSEGMDTERALKAFEQKVAPTNYKRPTAAITPKMIVSAMATLQELGLDKSIERRLATINDISVNNVLWVDNSVRSKMKDGGLADLLMKEVKVTTKDVAKNAVEISIDDFMQEVLPKTESMEVFFANQFQGNLMSLTAPVHADAPPLFKWANNFGWSYNGNIADSEIRRAVQAKGGRVDGVFRFSHSWNYAKRNCSLMDLHVFMPGSPIKDDNPIDDHYGGNFERVGWNHRNHPQSGGVQDVDFTAEAPVGYVPVENITFPDLSRMKEGKYICKIHNWRFRTPTEGGFKAEIEFGGQVFQYEYAQPLKNKQWITVAVVTLSKGVFSIEHKLPTQTSSQNRWNINTEQFVKVRTVLNSPNHWDGNRTGNKHVFFILDGCQNDEPARGIYNEFLRPELEPHRKVFEILGNKTKCEVTSEQLSGLGFSSTKRESVLIRVSTSLSTKLYAVNF